MGLTLREFYQMTWAEFTLAAQGHRLRQYQQLDNVRLLSFFVVKSNTKMKNLKPTDLFKLPIDPAPAPPPKRKKTTKAEWDAIMNRYFPKK